MFYLNVKGPIKWYHIALNLIVVINKLTLLNKIFAKVEIYKSKREVFEKDFVK